MKNSADVKSIAICASKMALFLLYWHSFSMMNAFGVILFSFVMFLSSFYVATIVHNSMHCSVFSNATVEFLWRIVLTATFGFPVEAYVPTHNLNHHVYTQHETDHLHTSQMKHKWHLLNLLLFFPKVYSSIAKLEREFVSKEAKLMSLTFYRFLSQVATAHGFTIYLFYLDWQRALACWFVPNILGIDAIITMNMLQHDGCATIKLGAHKGKDMDVNCARNFVGPVINFFTCNNGYHSIHHMYSNMHWTQYPEMHEKIIKPHIDPSLDEPCIVRYLLRTYFWPGVLPAWRKAE